ncbi:MAG: prepilin-type N-terminal cleavage/methylation domain-containing protein [Fibromonadaceae bacterium]|jgi:prepilin-type N-terminal cleavage/methylation domain-containing protein|nr:prepilin-type N-terminal cleavage/methylation domain-containing protein [Fibromonadaceae bacterium]
MEATLSILAIVVAIALWVAWFSFKFINFKTPFFHKNAAPAVQPLAASQAAKSAFTLLEVLVVVIIIGIL